MGAAALAVVGLVLGAAPPAAASDVSVVEALSCNGLPEWQASKADARRLVLSVDPSVANTSEGRPHLRTAMKRGTWLIEHITNDECSLGQRTYVHVALLVIANQTHPSGDMDLLDKRSFPWPYADVVRSGWPVFGLAGFYTRSRYSTAEEGWRTMSGCEDLAARADGLAGSRPLLVIRTFAEFLWNHLELRPTRRRIPEEPVREFLAFAQQGPAGSRVCELAVATAELALALTLLYRAGSTQATVAQRGPPTNGTRATMRLIQKAELRMRRSWRELHSRLGDATVDEPQDVIESMKLYVLLHAMVSWPIFELLQAIQNSLFGDSSVIEPSVGVPMDRDPVRHAEELEKKGPAFWHERRELLRTAVYGPAKAWLDGPAGPPEPRIRALTGEGGPKPNNPDPGGPKPSDPDPGDKQPGDPGLGSRFSTVRTFGVLALTWSLGSRMNSTALLLRSMGLQARGLVILHHGHMYDAMNLKDKMDPYDLGQFLTALGFDVMIMCMPYMGYNHLGEDNPSHNHNVFHYHYAEGDNASLAYFVAPVRLAIDWAERELGHRRFAMVGFSGGGWTTYLAAALEPRISLSVALVAGLPPHLADAFDWIRFDYEQRYFPEEAYVDCPMLCWYVLGVVAGAGSGPRWGVHLFHSREGDPYPTPNGAHGLEAELEDYYGRLLPRLIATSAGRPPEESTRSPAPLRLALTHSFHQHMGSWRDAALLEVVLRRWGALPVGPGGRMPGNGPFPAEWPMSLDSRHEDCWANGDAASA